MIKSLKVRDELRYKSIRSIFNRQIKSAGIQHGLKSRS